MLGYSKIQIMGNLGGVPEAKVLPSGESVVNFSVAVNRRYKDRDGAQKSATDWYRVCAFNTLGENCARYLGSGSPVFVEGRLQVRTFETKKGGHQVSVDIIPTTMRFLGGRGQAEETEPSRAVAMPVDDLECDVPF